MIESMIAPTMQRQLSLHKIGVADDGVLTEQSTDCRDCGMLNERVR